MNEDNFLKRNRSCEVRKCDESKNTARLRYMRKLNGCKHAKMQTSCLINIFSFLMVLCYNNVAMRWRFCYELINMTPKAEIRNFLVLVRNVNIGCILKHILHSPY